MLKHNVRLLAGTSIVKKCRDLMSVLIVIQNRRRTFTIGYGTQFYPDETPVKQGHRCTKERQLSI